MPEGMTNKKGDGNRNLRDGNRSDGNGPGADLRMVADGQVAPGRAGHARIAGPWPQTDGLHLGSRTPQGEAGAQGRRVPDPSEVRGHRRRRWRRGAGGRRQ
jgi:hypothetical protein